MSDTVTVRLSDDAATVVATGVIGPPGPQGEQGTSAPTTVPEVEYLDSGTLALSDASKVVRANKATALTVTVPPNGSVAFPVGTVILGYQAGAGQVTVAPGVGVTVRSRSGRTQTAVQWAQFALYKRATDEWLLEGALST